jgi:RNA polymerase sigma-70 factor (family 1)
LQVNINQEEEAIIAMHNGEEKGLDFFFNKYYTPLVCFSITITNDKSVSQEIASEAFVKLWKKKETISECLKVKFLLYKIVRNASIDYLREQKNRKLNSLSFSNSLEISERTIMEKLVETEIHSRLYQLLSKLPPRCRQIFQMFYFHDKPIKEIAQELGISVNTVKTQKQRAIQFLRDNNTSLTFLIILAPYFL